MCLTQEMLNFSEIRLFHMKNRPGKNLYLCLKNIFHEMKKPYFSVKPIDFFTSGQGGLSKAKSSRLNSHTNSHLRNEYFWYHGI